MLKYQSAPNGASGPRRISGASLAQLVKGRSPSERAVLAADILDGRIVVVGLTRKAVTTLCRANTNYVAAALRTTPEQRTAIRRGARALIRTRARTRTRAPAFDWSAISDD